jgi:hypothetical protein
MASTAFSGVQVLVPAFVKPLDVRQNQIARRVRFGVFAPEDRLQVPASASFGRDQRDLVEHFVAGEVAFQPLGGDSSFTKKDVGGSQGQRPGISGRSLS